MMKYLAAVFVLSAVFFSLPGGVYAAPVENHTNLVAIAQVSGGSFDTTQQTQVQGDSYDTTGNGSSGENITLKNPLGEHATLKTFLASILSFIVRIGAIAVILMLVYVGFLFVMARGEPHKISEARSALLWTLIGALVLLGAQAISDGIQATVSAISVSP